MKPVFIGLFCLGFAGAAFFGNGYWRGKAEYAKALAVFDEEKQSIEALAAVSPIWLGPRGAKNGDFNTHLQADLHQAYARLALKHLRRSLEWNVFAAPPADLILNLAATEERNGNHAMALIYLRELRSRTYASQSWMLPGRQRLPEINQAISRLSSRDPQDAAKQLQELSRPEPLRKGWSFLATLACVAWIGLTMATILRGVTKTGKVYPRAFIPLFSSALAAFLLFLLSLRSAG